MIPEVVSLLLGPTWLARFAPASLADLVGACESGEGHLSLLHVATDGMRLLHSLEVRPHDLEDLAALKPLVAYSSDHEVHEALAKSGHSAEVVLPDGADPAALWRVADRLGLTGWPIHPTVRDDRALVALDLARAAGLLPGLSLFAERRGAIAALITQEALRSETEEAPLVSADHLQAELPSLALELLSLACQVLAPPAPDGTPEAVTLPPGPARGCSIPSGRRRRSSVLKDGPGPEPEGDAADAAADYLAAPVILTAPPIASEPAEQAALLRLQRLRLPMEAVAAPDPMTVGQQLRVNFPWFGTAIDALVRELALSRLGGGPARLPPLLLHGPPGAGKSRFSRALAEACGLPLRRIAGPDAGVVTALSGNGRGWRSPQACAPVEAIAALGVRNPLLVVDDADRMPTGTHNGDPRAVLLGLLERDTARGYLDPLLAAPCDLSAVNWVLTANTVGPLGDALLDRLHRIEVPPPPVSAIDTVLTGMIADIAAEIGINPNGLPHLPEEVRSALGVAFAEEGTALRRVTRALRAALGAQASGADPLAAALEILSAGRPIARHPIGFVRPSPLRA